MTLKINTKIVVVATKFINGAKHSLSTDGNTATFSVSADGGFCG